MKRAGIIFFITVLILAGIFRITSTTNPVVSYNTSPIHVKIEPGSTGHQIAEKLYQEDLIDSTFLFNLLVNIRGLEDKLQAGYYEFFPSDNLWQVVSQLAEGRVATVKVTIPEGFTVPQIAERLAGLTFFKEGSFLEAAESSKFNRSYLPVLTDDLKYPVEGFLYPDTYIIAKEASPDKYIEIMLKEFEERWLSRLKKEGNRSGYTPYELVTIASLIEKEARLEEEKPVIAAVIYNRLKNGMLLQIDASVQYSLPERKERIYYRDLEFDSKYNTYLYRGLPPGPIANPGDSSIEAALNPARVDYLFYFALKDGSHVFSGTYQEHLQLQDEYR